MQEFKYYIRPTSCLPQEGLIGKMDYGADMTVDYGAKAVGYAVYNRQLTEFEMEKCGLVPTDAVHIYSITIQQRGINTCSLIVRANTATDAMAAITDNGSITSVRISQIA